MVNLSPRLRKWVILAATFLILIRPVWSNVLQSQFGNLSFLQTLMEHCVRSVDCYWPRLLDVSVDQSTAAQHLEAVQFERWPKAYRSLSLINLARDQHRTAQALLRAMLQEDPEDEMAQLYLAEVHVRTDEILRAIDLLEDVQAKVQLIDLGDERAEAGEFVEAIAAYDAAARIAPLDLQPRRMAAVLAEEIDPRDALNRYQQIIEIAPEVGWTYSHSGRVCFRQEEYKCATLFLQEALRRDPGSSPWVREMLGQSFAAVGNWEEAFYIFETLLRIEPERARTYAYAADALCSLGRTEEARKHYEEAVRLDSSLENARRTECYIIENGVCPNQSR